MIEHRLKIFSFCFEIKDMQFVRKLKSLDAKEKEDNFESHKTHFKKYQYNIVVLH